MSKLPSISGKNLISLLVKNGFSVLRTKGSHCFIKHEDCRSTVIPIHSNEDLGPGILSKILRDLDLKKMICVILLKVSKEYLFHKFIYTNLLS
jgi:predicted RNA binding protein YcfA (HicA-like mRNA interferase family)